MSGATWGALWALCSVNDESLSDSAPPQFSFDYVDISNVSEGRVSNDLERFGFSGAPSRARRLAAPGDVLISTVRTYLRAIALVEEAEHPRVYSTGFAILRPRDGVTDPRYLAYMLSSQRVMDEIIATSWGTSYPAIQASALHRIRVPQWPLPTQRAIADYLDRETGEIDAMLGKLDALAGVLEVRRREVVNGVLSTIERKPYLGLQVSVVSGSGFPLEFQGVSDAELPFFKVSSFAEARRGVMGGSENTVSRETAARLGATVIPEGSILMAKIGAALLLGRYARTDKPCCVDNNMQALVPRDNTFDARFLTYAMSEVPLDLLVKPGPVPSLDVMGMKMTRVACPLLPEQQRIADHLDEVTGRIDAMLAKVAQLKAVLTERRAALITDVVTGRKEVA